jgi:hypothetical protein
VSETIREMEEEYHENIRFGLQSQADTVSNLLEWYQLQRSRTRSESASQNKGLEYLGMRASVACGYLSGVKNWCAPCQAVSTFHRD